MNIIATLAAIVMVALALGLACLWLVSLTRQTRHIGKTNRLRASIRETVLALMVGVQSALALPAREWSRLRYGSAPEFANIAEGIHGDGKITKYASGAMATRFLFVERVTDDDHIQACNAATDIPYGVSQDEAEVIEDPVAVALLGNSPGTLKVTAGGTIAFGDLLVTTAAGKAQALPAAAATYYIVGRALQAGVDGDIIEFQHCFPVQRIVT